MAACAYEFGMTPGDVRAVLCVLLRDALIAADGRTPPGPKDGNPRYGEALQAPPDGARRSAPTRRRRDGQEKTAPPLAATLSRNRNAE